MAQHIAHPKLRTGSIITRGQLGKLAGLHPRRISALADEGKIPGLQPSRHGSYVRYFPAVLTKELYQWTADRRVLRKKKSRSNRAELGRTGISAAAIETLAIKVQQVANRARQNLNNLPEEELMRLRAALRPIVAFDMLLARALRLD